MYCTTQATGSDELKKTKLILRIISFHNRQNKHCQWHKDKLKKRKAISQVPFYKHIAPLCLSAQYEYFLFNRKIQRDSRSCKCSGRKLAEFETCFVAILTKMPMKDHF